MNQFLQCFLLSALVLALSQAAPEAQSDTKPLRADWSYSKEWTDELCKSGSSQSPIDLVSTTAQALPTDQTIRFNWENVLQSVNGFTENTGTSVEFSSPGDPSHIILDGKKYKLEKALYHWGSSEHSVDGKFFDGEIEFIHQLASGESKTAIVSIFLKKRPELSHRQENAELSGLKSTLKYVKYPYSKHTTLFTDTRLAFEHMLPTKKDFFRYSGSLSAPPCTEGVDRIVFKQPLLVTEDFFSQLLTLESSEGGAINKNVRAVQTNAGPVYKLFTGKQA